MATFELGECMAQLWSAAPDLRLSAALRLRELEDPAAGEELLRCLLEQVDIQHAWDFQRALLLALGASGDRGALGALEILRERSDLAPEVEEALGQVLVQLSVLHSNDVGPVLRLMQLGRQRLTQGALQAMALLRLVPSEAMQEELVDFALRVDIAGDAWSLIWILRAAPGWTGAARDRLIEHYSAPEYRQLKQVHGAVELARAGQYRTWGQF